MRSRLRNREAILTPSQVATPAFLKHSVYRHFARFVNFLPHKVLLYLSCNV